MKINKNEVWFYLFVVSSIIASFAFLFQIKLLDYVVRPFVLPFLAVYFIQQKPPKFSMAFFATILVCYIGDLYTLYTSNPTIFISSPMYLLSYVFQMNAGIDDFVKVRERMHTWHNLVLFLTMVLFSSIVVYVSDIMNHNNVDSWIVLIYGTVLVVAVAIAIINFVIDNTIRHLSYLFMILFFLFSDLFFIFHYQIIELHVFKFFTVLTQLIAYYFLMKYYTFKVNSIYD
ncbi:MAG: hypothetical protein KGZ81_00080 [Flavobacteriales bacterium]|nr:hypothetical protein [Flavobacteriales bacterium]